MAKGDSGSFGGVGGGMSRGIMQRPEPMGYMKGGLGGGGQWQNPGIAHPGSKMMQDYYRSQGMPQPTQIQNPGMGHWGGMISQLLQPGGGGNRLQYESPWGTGRQGPISGLFPGMGDRKNQVMPNQDFQQPGGMAQPGLRPMPGWMNSPEDYQNAINTGQIIPMPGRGMPQ